MKLKNWNNIVRNFLKKYNINNNNIITPFGFEVLDDKNFLMYELKRFYIFYNLKTDTKNFELLFMNYLRENYCYFYNQIYLYGSRENGFRFNNKKLKSEGFLISFEKKTTSNLLEDYSKYISSVIYFLAKKDLPEFSKIENVEMARLRIRQLFLISVVLYNRFVDQKIVNFAKTLSYAPSSIEFEEKKECISKKEQQEINDIIYFSKKILLGINNENNFLLKQNTLLFGTNEIKTFYFNDKIIKHSINKVKNTYLKYHLEEI